MKEDEMMESLALVRPAANDVRGRPGSVMFQAFHIQTD